MFSRPHNAKDTMFTLSSAATLPTDAAAATLVGRIWRPDVDGPSVVVLHDGHIIDVTAGFATMSDLCALADPALAVRQAQGERVCSIAELVANTVPDGRDAKKPWLLSPLDLQAVKAAGVTFAVSMLERVIEERARGNPDAAAAIRGEITALVGDDLSKLKPGSPEAMQLKEVLIVQGAWSQYMKVGIGPDAEIFTKAPVMASVGTGADAGLHPSSTWNNPEPEVVLIVAATGHIVGATLGNDVNLRDVEGRSALLSARPRIIMPRRRWGLSSASLMNSSALAMCGRWWCRSRLRAKTVSCWKDPHRWQGSAAIRRIWWPR
jgi:fumarylacetoacetate (FAA) hydrolase family protein